jgi:hypothetical protein
MENSNSHLDGPGSLSLSELQEKLEELKISLVLAEVKANEYCSELKNQIQLRKEKLVEEVNKSQEAMIQAVNTYQEEMLKKFKSNQKYKEKFKESIEEVEISLGENKKNPELLSKYIFKLEKELQYFEKSLYEDGKLIFECPDKSGMNLLGFLLTEQSANERLVLERRDISKLMLREGINLANLDKICMVSMTNNELALAYDFKQVLPIVISIVDKDSLEIKRQIAIRENENEIPYKLKQLFNSGDHLVLILRANQNQNELQIFNNQLNLVAKQRIASTIKIFCNENNKIINLEDQQKGISVIVYNLAYQAIERKNFNSAQSPFYYCPKIYSLNGKYFLAFNFNKLYIFNIERILNVICDFKYSESDVLLVDRNEHVILYKHSKCTINFYKVDFEMRKVFKIKLKTQFDSLGFGFLREKLQVFLDTENNICLFDASKCILLTILNPF